MAKRFHERKSVWFLGIFFIASLFAGFFALNSFIYQQKQGDTLPNAPYRGTLSGEYICLPHRNTNGPQTLECALGIKTEAGEYYAVDFNLMSQDYPDIRMGSVISANGVITPIENLSTDTWKKYPIEGIFSVTDSLKIVE